jgi:tetratricopeptide (TPR) repeat protein
VTTQGQRSPRSSTGVPPTTLASAREAYLRGDFLAVLDLLATARVGASAPVEAWLLRARALLKLHRPDEAAAELAPLLPANATPDERATVAMLHGTALARLVPADGLAALTAASEAARREGAHPAVCAEIAYFRALALWSLGDLEAAEHLAREAQRNGRDVLSVRAIQLRAFIAAKSPYATRFVEALALFRTGARAYGHCRERDLDLVMNITQQIAALEQTLRSAQIRGTRQPREASPSGECLYAGGSLYSVSSPVL